jgi:hypothetical protein
MRVLAGVFITLAAVLSPAAILSQVASATSPDVPEDQKTVQMVLYPAAEPRPALKYQLLPPFLERRPGNAAVWWNRITAERNGFFNKLYADNGPWFKIEKWMEIPIGDPREKEYREKELPNDAGFLRGGGNGSIFSDIERAARYESCDWEQPIREGNFIAILLPEIQQSRTYARLLSAKAHLEIAEGRYDEAVRTLQGGYALGRDLTRSPTLVSGMVGLTCAGVMSEQIRQLIQQPNAPNLYWALSTLPRPIVDLRLDAEAESNMLYLQFPELRDLDKKKLPPDEWRALLKRLIDGMGDNMGLYNGHGPFPTREASMAVFTMAALQGYPAAKGYLIEQGRPSAEVEAMPVAQVILLYTVRVYDELSDEQFKWVFLPSTEVGEGMARAERQLIDGLKSKREIIPVASFLLPASSAVKRAETRCEWVLAMLRVCEAMRLYAAAHDGQWPERLGDVTEVPIPLNPYDGKPFVYQRHGNKAILTSEKGPTNMPWRHEITLMPKAK